ncbi:MAG TPA: flippase, partial [bacterium]|nr:flippase [bacterium]
MASLIGIFKNTAAMLFGTILRMSASFILVIFIARHLGSEGMGKFSIVLTLFWIFQTIASMGIQPLLIREVAKDRSRTLPFLSTASFLSLIAALLMAALMIGFAWLLRYPEDVFLATVWIAVALLFSTLTIVFQSIFIAFERSELVLWGMTTENLVKLAAGIPALFIGGGIVILAGVFALSYFFALCISAILSRKYIGAIPRKIDWHVARWLIRETPTFAGISIFNTLFWNANVIILSKMVSLEMVGLFSAAFRMVNMVKLVLQSYKLAIQPVAAKTFEESLEAFQSFCNQSLRLVFMITIPVCVGGTILARPLMESVFGVEFGDAAVLFQITLWMLLFYGIVLVLATFLIASRNQRIDLRVNVNSTVLSLILHIGLIRIWSGLGAAIALLLSIAVFFLQQDYSVRRILFPVPYFHLAWKILLAAILMG